jgi:hypothetical protein
VTHLLPVLQPSLKTVDTDERKQLLARVKLQCDDIRTRIFFSSVEAYRDDDLAKARGISRNDLGFAEDSDLFKSLQAESDSFLGKVRDVSEEIDVILQRALVHLRQIVAPTSAPAESSVVAAARTQLLNIQLARQVCVLDFRPFLVSLQ